MEQVLTPETLLKINELNDERTSKFNSETEIFIDNIGKIVNEEVDEVDNKD